MKKRFFAVVATMLMLVATMLILSSCGEKQDAEQPGQEQDSSNEGATLSLNLSSPVGDTHPAVKAFNQFASDVSEGTNGKITISVYPNGSLGDQADGMAGLKIGTMNIQHCNAGPAAQVIPELDVFNLPYIFDNGEHLIAAMNGEVGEWVKNKFEESGFHYLGWIYGGSRSIITDVGPITEPADMKGLMIRVQSSDMAVAMINAMGGIGTPMAQSEVYSALQQDVIDGWENSTITLQSLSLYEVSQYFSRTEHLITPDFLLMSMNDWNAMSKDQQQVVTDAVDKALDYELQLWLEEEDSTEKLLVEEGVQFNDVDKEAFKTACEPLWDTYKSTYGDDVIKLIQSVAY